jgi:hypothetical protein
MLLDMDITKNNYPKFRKAFLAKGYAHVLPPYYLVCLQKTRFRPYPTKRVVVTDSSAEVPVKNLIEHFVRRIVETIKEVFLSYLDANNTRKTTAKLIVFWGIDGSSGQSEYKQKSSDGLMFNDTNLFATTLIPLKLSNDTCSFWVNPRPQSPGICRPIKLQFAKETWDLVLFERERVEQEFNNLTTIEMQINDTMSILVSFEFHLTMIDGKILISSQRRIPCSRVRCVMRTLRISTTWTTSRTEVLPS